MVKSMLSGFGCRMGLNSRGPGLQCRHQRGGGGEEVALGGAFADAGETWDDPGNLGESSWRIMKDVVVYLCLLGVEWDFSSRRSSHVLSNETPE